MNPIRRRDFLKISAASLLAQPFAARLQAVAQTPSPLPHDQFPPRSTLPRFVDPLPIPRHLAPSGSRNNATLYHLRMTQFTQRLHSALPPTRLWGYEGLYPGPTIEAFRGQPIEIEWENHLPAQHIFAVDPRIHGAMPPAPAVRTVPHLHGSRTASDSDGLPEKWFTPGHSVRYLYPNKQPAGTLWYHDHALGITRLNVYAGLSGLYLLRDPDEQQLALPAGDYEIPLILQDRTLDAQGQLVYAPTHDDGLKLPPGVWGPEFFGQLPVINGAAFPFLDVEPRPYRLRVLNSSNSRFFNLRFNLAKKSTDIPNLVPFQLIGTDGGFLPKPVALNTLLLGPAERADILLDFAPLAGKPITLFNDAAAPYPAGGAMLSMHAALIDEMMQFRVTLPLKSPSKSFLMPALPSFRRFDESEAVAARDFILVEHLDDQGRSLGVRINDKGYDDPVTEIVKLDSIEKWRFLNTTEDAHPMHLHLVQFQILHKQGFDPVQLSKGVIKPQGPLRPPAPAESGWKDTAVVLPGEMLTLIAKFEGFPGRYVFHCHMLEHEDNDMMRPYQVQP